MRTRARSRSEGQSTWSTATASGWQGRPLGGTGLDGNIHRPWRRETVDELLERCGGDVIRRARAENASARVSRGDAARGGLSGARGTAESVDTSVLLTGFRAHAWHCLLNMTDPMTTAPTTNWAYENQAVRTLKRVCPRCLELNVKECW